MPRRLALVAVAAAALLGGCGGGSDRDEVSVFPVDGTRTASASTQITFRGAGRGQLGTVSVEGTRSGAHTGRWSAHPDGRGTSFAPDAPFEPGERVTVRLGRDVAGTDGRRVEFAVAGVPSGRLGPVAPARGGR